MSAIYYNVAEARARVLWTHDFGAWAIDADGKPIRKSNGFSDVHSPRAVSFNRAGAVIRSLEEQVGVGKSTTRHFSTLDRRLGPDFDRATYAMRIGRGHVMRATAEVR